MRVRYWKANRSVARVQEVVEVRANGPLERTAHRRSRAAGAAPPPARRRGRPRPGGQRANLAGAGGAPGGARAWGGAGVYVLTARAAAAGRPGAPPSAGGERGRGPGTIKPIADNAANGARSITVS